MVKTFTCQLCGDTIREMVVPRIIADEELCVECYKTKYRALKGALSREEVK